jgi:hypothetical protein
MNRHQRRLRAKARPVRLPPRGSEDETVLRVLLGMMPAVGELAELDQVDVLEAADRMIELIGQGYFRLLLLPDGGYEIEPTEQALELFDGPPDAPQ